MSINSSSNQILTLSDIPLEFFDILKVLQHGIDKGYKKDGWLIDPESPTMDHVSCHNSIWHHVADSYCKIKEDHESGLDPKLHAAVRLLMKYTRERRGIYSVKDE